MFPRNVDNTILSAAKLCQTKARYAYIEDLSVPGDSVHLHFGGAVAYGLEVARRAYHDAGHSPSLAVEEGARAAWDYYGEFEPPIKSPKTRLNARRYIEYYFTIWPLDSDPMQPTRGPDGKLRVEWRFQHPIPDVEHPDGGPIYLVGRSDMIPEVYGMPMVEDDKSASQLGEKWGQQWPLDSQFLGYIWAAQQSGILTPDAPGQAMIRGIGVYTPKYTRPGSETLLKKVTPEEIEDGRAVYNMMKSFGHAQEMVVHAPFMIDRWLRETQKVIRRLIYVYINDPDGSRGMWDMALDKQVCGAHGGCSFQLLCRSENPNQWKEVNFVKRKWDPLETV